MQRLRSVLIVALIWMAAPAGSSAPDGFGHGALASATSLASAISPGDAPAGGSIEGKRWAVVAPPSGLRDPTDSADGKRWD